MKILAVDANSDDLKQLVQSLQTVYPEGEIQFFVDPLMALKHGYNEPVDVIFTDTEMPRLSGYDLVRLLRKVQKSKLEVHMIVSDEEACQDVYGSCTQKFLIKPVTAAKIRIRLIQMQRQKIC